MEGNEKAKRGYALQKWDLLLIQAAIGFGNLLISLPEASQENKNDIIRLQDVLRRVPEVTLGVIADYGLGVQNLHEDFRGINRDWWVEIRPDGNIAVRSLSSEWPDRNEREDHRMDDWFTFCPGEPRNYHPGKWERWADEVSDPGRWLKPGQYFEIDTDFRVVPQRHSAPSDLCRLK